MSAVLPGMDGWGWRDRVGVWGPTPTTGKQVYKDKNSTQKRPSYKMCLFMMAYFKNTLKVIIRKIIIHRKSM